MINLNKLEYNKIEEIEDQFTCDDYLQSTFIKKTYSTGDNRDHYFIYIGKINPDGSYVKQGYLYFYYNHQDKRSEFIGLYIAPQFRNKGLASLLVSSWIRICLDNEVEEIRTIQKQQKPFLIYLLKTYYFELKNRKLYETYSSNIHICKKEEEKTKYLYFENKMQEALFQKGRIYRDDNYFILKDLTEEVTKLDTVILLKRYFLQDPNEAIKKALKIKELHQR